MLSLFSLSGAIKQKVQDGSTSAVETVLGNIRALSLPDAMPYSIPSLRSIAKFALGSAQVALLSPYQVVDAGTPSSCPNPQLSCQNTTVVQDTCCFNAPGGQLLLTQFWDTNPPTGPTNSWTVHGLW